MYRYVIIDDETLIRQGTIKKIEKMCDYVRCVGEADDGAQGIALIEQLKPDFIILDMQMPGMDGTKLLPYLSEHYPEMPLIVISGFRDFDYIKHAISANAVDYLLKPFSREAIAQCISGAVKRIEKRQSVSQQIISSQEQKEAARYEYDIQNLTNLILGFHNGGISITSKKLRFIDDTHKLVLMTLYTENLEERLQIQDWLEVGGFGDLAIFLSSKSYPQMGFLILFLPNQSVVSVNSLLNQITDALLVHARQRGRPLRIGISQVHTDLDELHTAYQETASALNLQQMDAPSLRAYSYETEIGARQLAWEREDEFLFRVEAGMRKEVEKLIDALFDWFSVLPGLTLNDAKYYCYHLANQCKDILKRYRKNEKHSEAKSTQNIVSRIFTPQELKHYYRMFFLNINGMMEKDNIYATGSVIENIQRYIQHNYQKDLSQELIASLFYLNRSYLSTLFRQTTGVKFVDYLNTVRIDRAKEILVNSDRKMYQVAKTVGYDNTKYFFRVFKKIVGSSPEQYRSDYRKEVT